MAPSERRRYWTSRPSRGRPHLRNTMAVLTRPVRQRHVRSFFPCFLPPALLFLFINSPTTHAKWRLVLFQIGCSSTPSLETQKRPSKTIRRLLQLDGNSPAYYIGLHSEKRLAYCFHHSQSYPLRQGPSSALLSAMLPQHPGSKASEPSGKTWQGHKGEA